MKQAHILLVEDNEGDIILTLEAFDESRIKTDISVVKTVRKHSIFYYKKENLHLRKSRV